MCINKTEKVHPKKKREELKVENHYNAWKRAVAIWFFFILRGIHTASFSYDLFLLLLPKNLILCFSSSFSSNILLFNLTKNYRTNKR